MSKEKIEILKNELEELSQYTGLKNLDKNIGSLVSQ